MKLSPIRALWWEIWSRHQTIVALIVGLTIISRLLPEELSRAADTLWRLSFLLLYGMFHYTESSGSRGLGGFPRRLFTLPLSTLRLVAFPVMTGIASVEVLHLLWLDRATKDGGMSAPFVAVLLGALMVFYQGAIWTLEPLGPVRIVIVAGVAMIVFGIGLVPSFAPDPPPWWRSEPAMAVLASGTAAVVFFLTWRHIIRLRCGRDTRTKRLESVMALDARRLPRTQRAFASPAIAQFWFEWRCSGLALPVLVGAVLLGVLAPLSWFARDDAGSSLRLLVGTLATPIILAVPVGMAFVRPMFWSEDLSVPAFIAVRPMNDDDIIAAKVKVAAASVLISWLLVLAFLGVWLSLWANRAAIDQMAIRVQTFSAQSPAAIGSMTALIVIAGMFLTWRFLVCRLWSGLSGSRVLFVASVMSSLLTVVVALAFDATRLPFWISDNSVRLTAVASILAIAVTSKYWLAVYAWRRVSAQFMRLFLVGWGAGTACFLALAWLSWNAARPYIALEGHTLQMALVFSALLAVPLGRVGLAASSLARNRHR